MPRRRGRKRRVHFKTRVRAAGRRVGKRFRHAARHRVRMGLLGKAGVGIAVVPVAWAGASAITPWVTPAWGTVPIMAKLKGSLAWFTNTLAAGYGLGQPLTDMMVTEGTGAALPAGATVASNITGTPWISTTTVGLSFVIVDAVTGMLYRLAHKSAPRTKIMGKQVLTG